MKKKKNQGLKRGCRGEVAIRMFHLKSCIFEHMRTVMKVSRKPCFDPDYKSRSPTTVLFPLSTLYMYVGAEMDNKKFIILNQVPTIDSFYTNLDSKLYPSFDLKIKLSTNSRASEDKE